VAKAEGGSVHNRLKPKEITPRSEKKEEKNE
jgi:hypothetical protein